jgi:hypothetical protein
MKTDKFKILLKFWKNMEKNSEKFEKIMKKVEKF